MADEQKPKYTEEQLLQYSSIQGAALHNLDLVIDQLHSTNVADFDDTLECLDSARVALEKVNIV